MTIRKVLIHSIIFLKYCKKTFNSCCFSSLESAFDSINHNAAANVIAISIEESLKSEVGNRIDFANDILKNQKINKGEPKVHYNLMKYNKMREYNFWNKSVQMLP